MEMTPQAYIELIDYRSLANGSRDRAGKCAISWVADYHKLLSVWRARASDTSPRNQTKSWCCLKTLAALAPRAHYRTAPWRKLTGHLANSQATAWNLAAAAGAVAAAASI